MTIQFKDVKFITEIPKEAGRVVSMCEYNKTIYIACEYGVFFMVGKKLKQVKFYNIKNNKESDTPN